MLATAPDQVEPDKKSKYQQMKRELHSSDYAPAQLPAQHLPATGAVEHAPTVIAPVDTPLDRTYLDALAFNEEEIEIMIHPRTEENAPACTDLVSNQGKWAEVLFAGRWVAWGYLPVGVPVVTKRKYAQELARSKRNQVTAKFELRDGEAPKNVLRRQTIQVVPFTVIRDSHKDQGKAAEWFRRLVISQ